METCKTKVYIVIETTGEWEDFYQVRRGAFFDKKKAYDFAQSLREQNIQKKREADICQVCPLFLHGSITEADVDSVKAECHKYCSRERIEKDEGDFCCQNYSYVFDIPVVEIQEMDVE